MEEQEIWKDVDGYGSSYKISTFGNTISFNGSNKSGNKLNETSRPFKQQKNHDGYMIVRLSKNNKLRNDMVHRLVAKAFIPNPDNKKFVNHIDKDKTNNGVSNLEWVTRGENNRHSVLSKDTSSKYLGVYFDIKRNRWRARIHVDKKAIHLGRYKTEYEAHLAVAAGMKKYGIENKYMVK